jgi:HEAT repeat protein
MPLLPDQLDRSRALEILREVEAGMLGFDHRVIRRLLNTPEETIEALETLGEAPAPDRLIDLDEQVFDLFRYFRTPRAIPFYLRLLHERESGEVPDHLVEAFAELGAEAVEPLLAACAGPEAEDSGKPDLVFVLAALGRPDARIRALIEQTLQTDPYEGALCAGLSRDAALQPAVDRALAHLGPTQQFERRALLDALQALQEPGEPLIPEPFDILSLYPEEAPPVFDALPESSVAEFLSSESPQHRAWAAASFLDSDYEDETRDKLMSLAADDSAPEVRRDALAALGERVEEPAVEALLRAALLDSTRTRDERSGALIGLAAFAGEPEVKAVLLEFYEDPAYRSMALETMYRSGEAEFHPRFVENLRHENLLVRRMAVRGVGISRLATAAIELVPLFQDEDLREDALFAYAIAVPGPTNDKSVQKIFSQIEEKAGGLSSAEAETVGMALDTRLSLEGLPPVFFAGDEHPEEVTSGPVQVNKTGRNDPCPCGSGKKYKKCCGSSV